MSVIYLEYRREKQNEDLITGKVRLCAEGDWVGGRVLQTFAAVPFRNMYEDFVHAVLTTAVDKIYFKRLEQGNALPMAMAPFDVERLKSDPEKFIDDMCEVKEIVIDLTK